ATSQSSSASPETTLDLEKSDVPSARLTGSNHPPGPSPRHHNHRLLERCDSLSRVSPAPCRRIVPFHSCRQPERQKYSQRSSYQSSDGRERSSSRTRYG